MGNGGSDKKGVGAIILDYEKFKRTYKNTEAQCEEQGIAFIPMIVEAHGGGMSGDLRNRIEEIAKRQKCTGAECEGVEPGLFIAQRLSLCLQAENARAVWRRLPGEKAGERVVSEELWDVEDEAEGEDDSQEGPEGGRSAGEGKGRGPGRERRRRESMEKERVETWRRRHKIGGCPSSTA